MGFSNFLAKLRQDDYEDEEYENDYDTSSSAVTEEEAEAPSNWTRTTPPPRMTREIHCMKENCLCKKNTLKRVAVRSLIWEVIWKMTASRLAMAMYMQLFWMV